MLSLFIFFGLFVLVVWLLIAGLIRNLRKDLRFRR